MCDFDLREANLDFDDKELYTRDVFDLITELNEFSELVDNIPPILGELSDQIFLRDSSRPSGESKRPLQEWVKPSDTNCDSSSLSSPSLPVIEDEEIPQQTASQKTKRTKKTPASHNNQTNPTNPNPNPTQSHQRKKTTATKTSKTTSPSSALPAAKQPPPPIPKWDPRRTLTRLLFNAFNSCDIQKLSEVLNTHASDELVEIHRYDGVKNPYGRDLTKIIGKEAILSLWATLFKSAPDFFYEVLDNRSGYSPDWQQVVVSSRFDWQGTRIADIRIAKMANERILQRKLFESTRYTTDQEELLQQLMTDKSAVLEELEANKCNQKPPINLSHSLASDESYFGSHNTPLTLEASNEDKIYLDSNPLAVKKHMRCTGTLFLYLNLLDSKIQTIEIVFKALTESEESVNVSQLA